MRENNDKKYDLTPEEYNKCLTRAEIATFMKGETVEKPISIFVIAQAGAGKTGLRQFVVNEAEDIGKLGSYIEFNPDDISIHHEYYQEILEEFPDESYKILQRFVKPALDNYLRKRAVELRNSIVQEGTFGATQGYIDILEFQKNGGKAAIGKIKDDGTKEIKNIQGNYTIDINILAVDRFESLLSCYEREQYFREAGLPPRVVTMENHDNAYEKLLETVRQVESKKLFDKIRVFKRGYSPEKPELVYINGDNRYVSAVEAIVAERAKNRQELLKNPEKYNQRIEELRKRIKVSGIKEQEERLDNLENAFNNELEKNRESRSF